MACNDIAEHLIAHQILGVTAGAIRRDVIANRGTASDYQAQMFLEDRSALAQESDLLWISMYNGASWVWVAGPAAPPTSGGSPW